MAYLLNWRMAIAKDALVRRQTPIAQVADAVGYGSSSAFNTAFRRSVGVSPGAFVKHHT